MVLRAVVGDNRRLSSQDHDGSDPISPVPNSPDFVEHVRELMRARGREVTARAMFGGHGVYVDGLFVAIVPDDVLYLRAGERAKPRYDALGLEPFEYATRGGRGRAMSYRRAPDDAMESPAAMAPWLALAREAALEARKPPRGRKSGVRV